MERKKKLYRIMAAVSAVVSLLAVAVISVVLVLLEPTAGAAVETGTASVPAAETLPQPERVPAQPENQPEQPIPGDQPEPAASPSVTGAALPSGALDAFVLPAQWMGKISLKSETFYVKETNDRFVEGESQYDGTLLSLGCVPADSWVPQADLQKLGEKDGLVYYCQKPRETTFAFGEDPDADKDYYRMQNDLKGALEDYFTTM